MIYIQYYELFDYHGGSAVVFLLQKNSSHLLVSVQEQTNNIKNTQICSIKPTEWKENIYIAQTLSHIYIHIREHKRAFICEAHWVKRSRNGKANGPAAPPFQHTEVRAQWNLSAAVPWVRCVGLSGCVVSRQFVQCTEITISRPPFFLPEGLRHKILACHTHSRASLFSIEENCMYDLRTGLSTHI